MFSSAVGYLTPERGHERLPESNRHHGGRGCGGPGGPGYGAEHPDPENWGPGRFDLSGLVAAKVADRFYRLELPLAFAFFGGKKSIPIITFVCMIPIGLVIPVIWNVLTSFPDQYLLHFHRALRGKCRLLHPESGADSLRPAPCSGFLVRFTEAGGTYMINGTEYVGILNATNEILFNLGPTSEYWKQLMPTLTSYLGGALNADHFVRVPAIGLAMYHTSFLKNRKIAKGVILTCCLTAFLGNITEPLEFSFPVHFTAAVYPVLRDVRHRRDPLPDVKHLYRIYPRNDFRLRHFGLLYEGPSGSAL